MSEDIQEFKTTHNLDFEVAGWERSGLFQRFKVGTCTGLWRATSISYEILAISNSSAGNGHLDDVFEWFENSCKRDGKNLWVLELLNDDFKNHLIEKRGFHSSILGGKDNIYKSHNEM